MTKLPEFHVDPAALNSDPYPIYAEMRAKAPIAHVPELDATVFTRRDDIFVHEKNIEVFSSEQPDGLMNKLMGINMMRKDGDAHQIERRAIFPAVSPRTARDIWMPMFDQKADALLAQIAERGQADLMADFAAPLAGETLKIVTGLTSATWQDIDRWSQTMVEGVANYAGDKTIEDACKLAVREIDEAVAAAPPSDMPTMINAQRAAGLSAAQTAANIRLAISGGQNETRDAISGIIWTLLQHPEQSAMIRSGKATFANAFDEYVRWMAPIGMSPRRVAKPIEINGFTIPTDKRVFFMFGSANRDEAQFERPNEYDLSRDPSRHIAFGAGPHFCAGAPVAKTLVAQVALPKLFQHLNDLALIPDKNTRFLGWAFRGLTQLPTRWKA